MTNFGRGKGMKFMTLSRYARIKLVKQDIVLRVLRQQWIEAQKKELVIERHLLDFKDNPKLVHDLRQTRKEMKLLHDNMKQRIKELGYDERGI